MPDDKTPEIIIMPEAQARIDADPELAKMVRDMSAMLRQVMQGVKDGKYASFDEGCRALGIDVTKMEDDDG